MAVESIKEIHRRFCELLPDALLWVENPEVQERHKVMPGLFPINRRLLVGASSRR
jgi:hypothetical protein